MNRVTGKVSRRCQSCILNKIPRLKLRSSPNILHEYGSRHLERCRFMCTPELVRNASRPCIIPNEAVINLSGKSSHTVGACSNVDYVADAEGKSRWKNTVRIKSYTVLRKDRQQPHSQEQYSR